MATVGGKQVREVAKARLAALKDKPKPSLLNAIMSPDAKQIKNRIEVEKSPDVDLRRGGRK